MISKVVASAIQLWLRSQVEQVKDLQVTVEGGDRQILAGRICQVCVAAEKAVYQGLHLSYIGLVGQNIQINLGQVLRGQPLRLLAAVPIQAELLLQTVDLNASLQAPLLATAVGEFLLSLLQATDFGSIESAVQSVWLQQIAIDPGLLILQAQLALIDGSSICLCLRTGLQLVSTHELRLDHPQWLSSHRQQELPLNNLQDFKLDLGPDISLQELRLEAGQLTCRGHLKVLPSES